MAVSLVDRPLLDGLPAEGVEFDGLLTLLTCWFIVGVFLDGRSHTGGAPETFFTVEHGLFYAAFLAITGLLGGITYRNRTRGTFLVREPARRLRTRRGRRRTLRSRWRR